MNTYPRRVFATQMTHEQIEIRQGEAFITLYPPLA